MPLHRRVVRSGQLTSSSTVFSEETSMQDVIYRSMWNKGENHRQMDLTVCEVAEGNMTVRKVAVSYGIPKSTLHDQVKGKVQLETGIGAQRYLTNKEEEVA